MCRTKHGSIRWSLPQQHPLLSPPQHPLRPEPADRDGATRRGVRIATILTQSGIPGRNPRVLYGCYPVQSLSPFPFRSQLPFRPLVRSLYLHPNSLCHIHSLVSSIVFTCSPDLSLCALRFPSDFLWTRVSSPLLHSDSEGIRTLPGTEGRRVGSASGR